MIREQWNDILTVRVPLQQLVKTRLLNLENLFRNTAEKINTRKSASNKKKNLSPLINKTTESEFSNLLFLSRNAYNG